jgi:hypothetical protein
MDTWSVLLPALLSLLGVGIGTLGAVLGQYQSTRLSRRQQNAQEWAAQRTELRASIMRFLSMVHQVKPIVVPDDDSTQPQLSNHRVLDELWLAQHELDLVAISENLRGAAYRYARAVSSPGRVDTAEGPRDDVLRDAQREFMDAARADLWPHAGPTVQDG